MKIVYKNRKISQIELNSNKNLKDTRLILNQYITFPFIYLDDFCVDSNYRGLGIGTKLISYADEYASNNNFGNLRLHVENENLGSIRFYNNLGFQPLYKDDHRTLMQKPVMTKNIDIKRTTL